MQIKGEGYAEGAEFKRIWNVPVYKTGMKSIKLKRRNKQTESQFFMLHTKRKATYTTVVFESIAAIYNNLQQDVHFNAFLRSSKGQYIPGPNRRLRHDQIHVSPGQVKVIPISWFEKGYEVRVAQYDANQQEEESKDRTVVLSNIKKVLNPNITEPYDKLSQQIKISKNWVAFEIALLQTRNRACG